MKINWKVRFKNPNFWIGIVALLLMAMGVEASMFTTWQSITDAIKEFCSNPFMIGTFVIALWGYIQDFTTKGVKDTELAMSYVAPRCEEESVGE